MFKTFLRDSAVYAVPSFISRGLSLFLVPLYTRVLSPADYGSLDLLMVFASIVNLVVALEVSQGVARFYTEENCPVRKALYASSAFWFTLVCYSVFCVLMWFGTEQLAPLIMGQAGFETAFRFGLFFIWINGLFLLIQNQLRWELRSREYAAVSLLMTFVGAGASVWLAYYLRLGIEGLLIGGVSGSLAGSVLGLSLLRTSFRFQFSGDKLYEMLKFSSPLVISGIATWISLYVDRMMISYYLSIDDLGLYGIGYRLASIVTLVMVGFQSSLTPLIYNHYQKPDTPIQLERIFRYFLAFALFVYLVLTLFAFDILRVFTTESFLGGAVVVKYLVPAMLLANMYIFAPGISLAKKTHYFIWINLGGACLNILFNIFFIPLLGIIGAALATTISYLIVFTTHMLLSQRYYPVPHRWGTIMGCAAFFTLVAWGLPNMSINWITNLVAITLCMYVAVWTRLIPRHELRFVAVKIREYFSIESKR